jgi:hypothetical protein
VLRAQLRSSLMADAVAGGDPECVRILHRMGGKVDFKDAVRLHTPPHVLLLVSLALAHVCCMVQGGGENTSAASVVLRSRKQQLLSQNTGTGVADVVTGSTKQGA